MPTFKTESKTVPKKAAQVEVTRKRALVARVLELELSKIIRTERREIQFSRVFKVFSGDENHYLKQINL